jgi:hypothetical protein
MCSAEEAGSGAAQEGSGSRVVRRERHEKGMRHLLTARGNDVLMVAKMESTNLSDSIPINRGFAFPSGFDQGEWEIVVDVRPPQHSRDGQWRLSWGSATTQTHRTLDMAGFFDEVGEEETQIPPHIVQIPISQEGIELYMIPYKIAGGRMHSLLIIIAQSKELIREHVDLKDTPHFRWDLNFIEVK